MNEEDALKIADALHEFVAAAPHDYPGHSIALFESAEAAIRSLVADRRIVWRSPAGDGPLRKEGLREDDEITFDGIDFIARRRT